MDGLFEAFRKEYKHKMKQCKNIAVLMTSMTSCAEYNSIRCVFMFCGKLKAERKSDHGGGTIRQACTHR